jgi:hypothetical protein
VLIKTGEYKQIYRHNGALRTVLCTQVSMFTACSSALHHHCAVRNLTYSRAKFSLLLLSLIRLFSRQNAACKQNRNMKTKKLCTHVHMCLHNF